jgi:hypothetical protein
VAELLLPLLAMSGVWIRPSDGCAVAIGVLPIQAINLSVGLHPQCKFALVITEGALGVLPPEELQAAMGHELGHVQLAHFEARRERRLAERKRREEINEKGVTAGAAVTAIPVIGPLLAMGVAGTQSALMARM